MRPRRGPEDATSRGGDVCPWRETHGPPALRFPRPHARRRRDALAALLAAIVAPLLPERVAAKRGRGEGRRDNKSQKKNSDKGPARGGGNDRAKGQARDQGKGKDERGGNGNDRGKGRGKNHRRQQRNQHQRKQQPAQAEAACYAGTNCTPGPGKNLGRCDFSASSTLKGKNLKGANLGAATVARGDASGAILEGANLDKTCLVDATLRDATINASTNLGTAILCRTTMPDGSISNAGCNRGTSCCPTCDAAHPCPSGQVCCQGRCRTGNCCTNAQCPDPAKPICLNFTCAPCTTDQQCGNGKRCCDGQCKTGICCTASDCADRSCQTKTCANNQCAYAPAPGAACNDGNPCTIDDVCQSDGSCRGTPKNCANAGDACNDGVCRDADGECVRRPKEDGSACSDSNSCTVGDSCQNGECRPGAGVNCRDLDDACNTGVCNPATGVCFQEPKGNGTSCNADSDACTEGDSCQGGRCVAGPPRSCPVCTACHEGGCQPVANDARCATTCCNGACCDAGEQCVGTTCQAACPPGTDCSGLSDQCNDGVCDPASGGCVKRRKENGTACSATGSACTEGDSCQGGECVAGAAVVCGASDECHVAGVCDPLTGICSNPNAADGTPCGDRGSCEGGACVEPCLGLNAVCDEATDVCCDSEGEVCSPSAFCAELGDPGRCCRDEGHICSRDCDCCEGGCAGGICCRPNQQCRSSGDCCEGQSCMGADPGPWTCLPTCGTANAFCHEFPCCAGYRCVNEICYPEFCLAPTEECTAAGQCCQDGGTVCGVSAAGGIDKTVCCHPFNQTCQDTDECCSVNICGPQHKCCRSGFFDPERGGEQARGCVGRENECCPGRRCNRFNNLCCLNDGQPVSAENVADCCHPLRENGVCSCRGDGGVCTAIFGNPAISVCCDGFYCVRDTCEPACNPFFGSPCGAPGQLPCCRGGICRDGICQ